ncbi:DUF402 domain-containing protein [Pediococcus claussenii]|uniref:DUF402 domain-containing protein n=1 Tax=Pediococcus claussenii (strain ATCC BAA-344 / DSM 14800 / JCM 18046 / KCTC 3811 / LMG 21948 / P06) TaxID=701521 RepID=G8PDY2_PEDCP|nr:DUF402 domain-containing protein [Pediococcus claussenii]AEV95467.1 hypothetical protein PECL_1234 [Pediococcus claussenii ATCC BAA-344]ANZ68992.1 hypothetical protein AYR57_01165 [Pediococcus claussenii]ANZ70808.1 hypothetical protein AYR58_01165 [Pediococcus claussenii]KRN20296.1 hypothetical protein IV79_GL000965 [Pediococcus claussenii]
MTREMNQPKEGEYIAIKSYKHDGRLHRTWRDTMVLKNDENEFIGCNDHTIVVEEDGRHWMTKEPALVYFNKHNWFNIVTMIRKSGVSYYCNIATPYVLDREALKYIDYDLDVKIFPNGDRRLLDVDEFMMFSKKWHYPQDTINIVMGSVSELTEWIDQKRGPFSTEFVNIWYNRYLSIAKRNNSR